jgi:hypothetical protein
VPIRNLWKENTFFLPPFGGNGGNIVPLFVGRDLLKVEVAMLPAITRYDQQLIMK